MIATDFIFNFFCSFWCFRFLNYVFEKPKPGNPEGFRVTKYPREPVLRALIRASARRGVLVKGSAGHDVKKNNTQERQST